MNRISQTLASALLTLFVMGLVGCGAKSDDASSGSSSSDKSSGENDWPGRKGEPSEAPKNAEEPEKPKVSSTSRPSADKPKKPEKSGKSEVWIEPQYVKVAHVLISFQGVLPGVTRSKADAEKLAEEIYQRALGGEDFQALVKEYSDDRQRGVAGGPYGMSNTGAPAKPGYGSRTGMVGAFGNVGFSLKLDEIGMSKHGPDSHYGWHIIKRIE